SLAGAVGAEQAEDLAPADLDVEGPQGGLLLPAPEVAVDLGQLAGFDDHVLGHGATSMGCFGRPGALGAGPPLKRLTQPGPGTFAGKATGNGRDRRRRVQACSGA